MLPKEKGKKGETPAQVVRTTCASLQPRKHSCHCPQVHGQKSPNKMGAHSSGRQSPTRRSRTSDDGKRRRRRPRNRRRVDKWQPVGGSGRDQDPERTGPEQVAHQSGSPAECGRPSVRLHAKAIFPLSLLTMRERCSSIFCSVLFLANHSIQIQPSI